MLPFRKTLPQLLQTQPPHPPPTPQSSSIEPRNQAPDLVLPIEQPLQLPNARLLEPQNQPDLVPIPNAQQEQNHFDFPTLVLAFCLTGAMEIAVQNHTVNPLIFHLLGQMVVFAFASIFVAKYIAPKHPNAARMLDHVGVFFGVTAFFLAVTISFPLCLVIISWIIYGLSLLAIIICNCPRPLFPN
ncbi:hypothetical protein Vadar_002446 [Vaccinium darrowii]|uniref:Uncharacterized protein n=1 Tax=Vaccinium darrowii TaxID=229202 RepID=A0ACB7YTJ7_9ERIC|nr:hypothetical protein Vadar_002446 [Vaccinium darrowii]